MPIAKRIAAYQEKGSFIRKLFTEGMQMAADGSGRPVYDFSIGNPDLEPPPQFKEILKKLIDDDTPGTHKYMSNAGYPETRQAVAAALETDLGLPFCEDSIVMTVGAGGALNAALKAVLDIGEEVIAVAPYFVEYRFYAENHGAHLVIAPSRDDFDLDVAAIEAKITDRTRVVIINNPNNPSGKTYPQTTLNELGEMLRRRSAGRERPIFLIDDAPYRKLIYDIEKCPSIFLAYENAIMGTSHSKDLGLPGERIGYLAVSPRMNEWQRVATACVFTNRTLGFVNAPALMQRVAQHLQSITVDLDWYRTKRDLLYNELTAMGYETTRPDGAFYIFPKAPGGDDMAFIQKLKDRRVLVVPGSAFGCPGHFRICYCVAEERLRAALPAFEAAIKG